MSDELANLDAMSQAELVRRGEVQPIELVDAAIARIEQTNPRLNAVITPLYDKAREEARSPRLPQGPFRGVPYLLKDLDVYSAGDPFHCGMRFLRDLRWVQKGESYLVAKLRAAGFVFVGKTNTPELGLNVTTEPAAYGPCRNPWNTEHSSGGSSGGSAAAVAARMVPAAHASDGGGSIRIPASECGLVGLKPSRGRMSLGPDYGEYWHGLVISHAVSRTVRDTAAILDATAGAMPGDPYTAPAPSRPYLAEIGQAPGRLRIGFVAHVPSGMSVLHPECVAAVRGAAELLASLGHTVEESHPAALAEQPEVSRHFTMLISSWCAFALDEWSRATGKTIGERDVEPTTWAFAELGRACAAPRYLESIEWLHGYTRRMSEWWAPSPAARGQDSPAARAQNGFDVLVTPTIGEPPPRLGELKAPPGQPLAIERALGLIPFTPPFNITGQPAISLPLHWSADGLPVGVQLVADYGREDLLFRVAADIERARPWSARRPPVSA